MQDQFRFKIGNKLMYGIGSSRRLPEIFKEENYQNVAILVDKGVVKHAPYYQEIKKVIENAATVVHLDELRDNEEPDYDFLDEVAAKVRALDKVDVIIAIGGGSCMDTAKAVAVLKTNPGKGIEYRGFDHAKVPGVPTICIPTTAGTGSEVTINAVFINKQEKVKLGINGNYLNATYAVLDAEWTASCPKSIAVSSGMDAVVHTMESFMCHQANPVTRSFAREAFKLLYENLPALIDEPENAEKRQNILLGAYLGAISLFNSGSGIAGSLSYPLGVHWGVPHGVGGGFFIADVVEYNVSKGYTDYAELLDMIEANPGMSLEDKSKRFAGLFRELSDKLEVPQYLTPWGVTKDDWDKLMGMMDEEQGAFDQNPIPFSAKTDVQDMLKKHIEW